ncbi:MAG: M20 family metallo-hydrolase [Solirubrobacteraceae bacterium]
MSQASSLNDDLSAAARFGGDGDGVTRFAWSPELLSAHRWLAEQLEALGLAATLDAAGNVIGRWEAGSGKAVVIGSHLDTVPSGGRYDGALGVLAGLDVIRRLKAAGVEPARPVWLASFMDEEGARFRTALLGSRAFVGEDLTELAGRLDPAGGTLRDGMTAAGFDFDRLPEATAIGSVGAYLELHIEQGRVLESAGAGIGIVTGLAGMFGMRATLRGRADHAGTTPMNDRRDALVGASRAIVALRDHATRQPGLLRMTVGTMSVEPGGFNIVPASCEFSIDVRAERAEALDGAREWITALLEDVARDEDLELDLRPTHGQPPHDFDEQIIAALRRAAAAEGAKAVDMKSGAGHDAMVIGRHAPAAMLFVPSRDGLSHTPAEYTSPEQCELGARVLAGAVRDLAEAS